MIVFKTREIFYTGGMKSIFLMGCLDEYSGNWCTVTKVRGFSDDELAELQGLEMTKISKVNYTFLKIIVSSVFINCFDVLK